MNEGLKRQYRNSLDFVESGFHACWRNARDLIGASKALLESGLHAPALSLAILALEELAKLYAIDGLLYARRDDHKAEAVLKAFRSHSTKLMMFETFPLFLGSLAKAHPGYGQDHAFALDVAVILQNLKEDGNAVMSYLEEGGFLRLDMSKQDGFYVCVTNSGFVPPCDAVDPAFAGTVYRLAWRATTAVDFLLKDGNLERYIDNARAVRGTLSEKQHRELERLGEEWFKALFSTPNDER